MSQSAVAPRRPLRAWRAPVRTHDDPAATTARADRGRDPGRPGQAPGSAQAAAIVAVHAISARFRLVTLRADAFRCVDPRPGDSLRLRVRPGVWRTFSACRLGDRADAVSVVVYLHGGATPAASWATAIRPGDPCSVRTLEPTHRICAASDPTVAFGDETSIGLIATLCDASAARGALEPIVEVDEPADARRALANLARRGYPLPADARLLQRLPGAAHLVEAETVLACHARSGRPARYLLSGGAGTVLRLSRALGAQGIRAEHCVPRVHWAPHRRGLD